MSDPFEELQQRLDHPASPWYWDNFDEAPEGAFTSKSVMGVVESIETRESEFGTYPFLIVKDRKGDRISIAGLGTVLLRALSEVRVGDALAIDYVGKAPASKEGLNDYDNFTVERIKAADLSS